MFNLSGVAAQDGTLVARIARLQYVTDSSPGIRRVGSGKNFKYLDPRGKIVRDEATLKRIRSLVIPPAWKNVWICPLENGHLQATGHDARNRKQYRYHPRWREVRDETKYNRMLAFAKVLPRIRRQVARDLRAPGLSKRQVLATVARLLEVSLIRVGNEEYTHENGSHGLTTLKNRHAKVRKATIQFHFRAKSGKMRHVEVEDPRLAKIVRECRDIPGQDLFQYIDAEGQNQPIRSEDVNDYIHEIGGEEFTAKDFRTWAGTVLAGIALQEFEKFDTQTQAKKNVVQAVESVSARLGNTPAVCKKCYIHPDILDGYLQGATIPDHPQARRKRDQERVTSSRGSGGGGVFAEAARRKIGAIGEEIAAEFGPRKASERGEPGPRHWESRDARTSCPRPGQIAWRAKPCEGFNMKTSENPARLHDRFRLFAHGAANFMGNAWSFCFAIVIILVWALTGPMFHFSDTWQLIINTGTTIVTFLMVFLIQNTQNRDAKAIHLKLDELIRAMDGARNKLIYLESLSDDELARLRKQFDRIGQNGGTKPTACATNSLVREQNGKPVQ